MNRKYYASFLQSLLLIFNIVGYCWASSTEKKHGRKRSETCYTTSSFDDAEETIETVRKIVRQWPDYVNTGNQGYLIKNYIQPDATMTQTGSPLNSFCLTVTKSMVDYLLDNQAASILSDILNIKRIKYNKRDKSVMANFMLASGVQGFNLSLSNESWVFVPSGKCNYKVSEAVSVKLECIKQENNCPML